MSSPCLHQYKQENSGDQSSDGLNDTMLHSLPDIRFTVSQRRTR